MLYNEIKRAYENRDPHEITLKFCYNLKESLDKASLTHTLLEMLLWIKNPIISDELKIHAFNNFSQTSRMGFILASKAYRLKESKHLFIEKIKKIAEHPWATQAAIVAIELGLCEEFPIDLILIPLWLENKYDIYFEYMDVSKSSRMKMVNFLDSLMESEDAYSSYLLSNNITSVKLRTRKIIKTHIFKLRDRFQIAEKETPITTLFHYTKYMKYIMCEYYDCKRMSKEIYEDKIIEIVDKNIELQKSLVQFTNDRGHGKDATKWKDRYNVDIKISSCEDFFFERCKFTDETESFYKLPIDASKIIIVDNEKLFDEMLEDFKEHSVIGLDCEQQINSDLSIIQLATNEKVFIIDAMTMREKFDWKKLAENLFNTCSVTKLGCGILGDVRTIEKFLAIKIDHSATYIDLGKLSEKLMAVKEFKFPFQKQKQNEYRPGLSKLTKLCLGKDLNKSFAISNWTMRPLRAEQLHYAALDAYCAIEIFYKINEILYQLNLTYEDIYYKENNCKDKKKDFKKKSKKNI